MSTDNNFSSKPLVYFVGLSAKPMREHLDCATRTGKIIEQIVQRLPSMEAVKTNLVTFPPIDQEGALRYPNASEMDLGWNRLRDEISQTLPSLLVTLGQQVSWFVREQLGVKPAKTQLPPDYSYKTYPSSSQFNVLSVHHPSFVYVYRRRDIQHYVENVIGSIDASMFDRTRSADGTRLRIPGTPHLLMVSK